jgi:two-component system NtrC family response regulator
MRDRILILDDEANLRTILEATLVRAGYDAIAFSGFEEAKTLLDTEDLSAVLTDLQMPGKDGMGVLQYCRQYSPDLPVILVTAYGTVERAVSALKAGAFDFVVKPFDPAELIRILEKACQNRRFRRMEPALEIMSAVGVGPVPVPLFGSTKGTLRLREDVERISKTDSSVLMLGEVGTGKRSIAHEIHRRSDRVRQPFIQVACGALPPVFQASELFGVEKGASPVHLFSKPGAFELAQGGTLFLEEIDHLSVESQNALFSALESESFTRVGGVRMIPTDFRILSTTSRDLSNAVREGRFHVELYFKLSTSVLDLQPLRERAGDIPSDLLPYFLTRACGRKGIPVPEPDPGVAEWLIAQEWPGNLGEFERSVQRAVDACSGGRLRIQDFSSP